jgi:hypothetical protein
MTSQTTHTYNPNDAEVAGFIDTDCSGPNKHCRRAHAQGSKIHFCPPQRDNQPGPLLLPNYHFASIEDAEEAYWRAVLSARIVTSAEARDAALARHEPVYVLRGSVTKA